MIQVVAAKGRTENENPFAERGFNSQKFGSWWAGGSEAAPPTLETPHSITSISMSISEPGKLIILGEKADVIPGKEKKILLQQHL